MNKLFDNNMMVFWGVVFLFSALTGIFSIETVCVFALWLLFFIVNSLYKNRKKPLPEMATENIEKTPVKEEHEEIEFKSIDDEMYGVVLQRATDNGFREVKKIPDELKV